MELLTLFDFAFAGIEALAALFAHTRLSWLREPNPQVCRNIAAAPGEG